MALVAAEARAGDGGGMAQGRAFRSEAARAMAGARDGGGTTRGRAKAEARCRRRVRATVEAPATVEIEHPLEPTLLPSVPISLWRTKIRE
jgi:hypothetical protein